MMSHCNATCNTGKEDIKTEQGTSDDTRIICSVERSQEDGDKLTVSSASTKAVVCKALALAALIAIEVEETHQMSIKKRGREGNFIFRA